MRRTLFSAVLVGAALALIGCAGQDSVLFSGGQGETQDGSLRVDAITAVSGPSGESAGGHVAIEVLFPSPTEPIWKQLSGPVTCLAVDGADATLNFDDETGGPGVVTITVHDGNPDTFGARLTGLLDGRRPSDCSAPSDTGEQALITGHISIVDSQPPPPTAH